MDYFKMVEKYGSKCRLCVRRGPLNSRSVCETCRCVQTGLFEVRRKYGAEVLGMVAERIGVDLATAQFTWTTLTIDDGAFIGIPEEWGTRAYEDRSARYLRHQMRHLAKDVKLSIEMMERL